MHFDRHNIPRVLFIIRILVLVFTALLAIYVVILRTTLRIRVGPFVLVLVRESFRGGGTTLTGLSWG